MDNLRPRHLKLFKMTAGRPPQRRQQNPLACKRAEESDYLSRAQFNKFPAKFFTYLYRIFAGQRLLKHLFSIETGRKTFQLNISTDPGRIGSNRRVAVSTH